MLSDCNREQGSLAAERVIMRLMPQQELEWLAVVLKGLNAPYGARCFLTCVVGFWSSRGFSSLNAPYGARRFLTQGRVGAPAPLFAVS